MNKAFTYGIGVSFCGFALVTLNWYIETSIAAGTIVWALLTLMFATVGVGLIGLNHRAQCRREAAREARYRAFEDRSRRAEEREAWYRERSPWN